MVYFFGYFDILKAFRSGLSPWLDLFFVSIITCIRQAEIVTSCDSRRSQGPDAVQDSDHYLPRICSSASPIPEYHRFPAQAYACPGLHRRLIVTRYLKLNLSLRQLNLASCYVADQSRSQRYCF